MAALPLPATQTQGGGSDGLLFIRKSIVEDEKETDDPCREVAGLNGTKGIGNVLCALARGKFVTAG